jgi:hypothetical protein
MLYALCSMLYVLCFMPTCPLTLIFEAPESTQKHTKARESMRKHVEARGSTLKRAEAVAIAVATAVGVAITSTKTGGDHNRHYSLSLFHRSMHVSFYRMKPRQTVLLDKAQNWPLHYLLFVLLLCQAFNFFIFRKRKIGVNYVLLFCSVLLEY